MSKATIRRVIREAVQLADKVRDPANRAATRRALIQTLLTVERIKAAKG